MELNQFNLMYCSEALTVAALLICFHNSKMTVFCKCIFMQVGLENFYHGKDLLHSLDLLTVHI